MMDRITGSCIVAGHICLDIIPELPGTNGFLGAIQPGHLLPIGAATIATGGSVSNTGLALHKLGIQTQLMGKIGDDSFGKEICSLLAAIDKDLVSGMHALANEHTSYTIILSPSDADRVFLHNTGANDTFGPEDIDYATLYEADMFHFGYPTAMARMFANDGQELAELLQRAKETGITTSLDTSMFDRHGDVGSTNWEVLLKRALPHVDIFLPSLDEILLMLLPEKSAGAADMQLNRDLAESLLDFGAGIVVLKQGKNGLYLRSRGTDEGRDLGRAFAGAAGKWRNRELWSPAFQVSVVGTTGAGDCAVGGFLASVLRGLGVDEALLIASAVGACNVESADATSGLRSWPETAERIEAGWKQRRLELPGWTYDKALRIWSGPLDGQ